MKDQPSYLRDLWHFFQRNRFLVLGIPVLTVLVTAAFVQLATPVYESEAMIRVDEERSSVPMAEALRSLTMMGGGSKIATEMAVLRTRVVAEDVVDSLNLHVNLTAPRRVDRRELFTYLSANRDAPAGEYRLERRGQSFLVRGESAGRAGPAADRTVGVGEAVRLPGIELMLSSGALAHDRIELVVEPFPDALRRFRRTVRVDQPVREADVISVRYQGSDRRIVRDVPAVMANVFIDRRQAGKSSEARATVEFLDGQIALVAGQLAAIEDDLRRFREQHRLVSVEAEATAEIERLARLQGERDAVDAERTAILASLERIQADGGSVARRLMYFPTLLRNAAASEVMVMLADLENRRSQLLELRTPEDPEVVVLTERIEDMERELAANALTYVDGLTNQVTSYDRTLDRFRTSLDAVPARHIQLARMQREAGLLEEMYLLLETRRKQGEIDAAITDRSVQVVDPPALPTRPIRPRKLLSVLLAGMLGVVLGGGVAFLREQMDTRVRTREDLRSATGEAPVLGAIPRIAAVGRNEEGAAGGRLARVVGRRNGGRATLEQRLVTGVDPDNPVSEAYRSLRTNITFARLDAPPRTLVFTSAMPGEGKSTSASNLAITLAQQGHQSVLVDADLRRGSLHRAFGVTREPGLSDALLGRATLEDVVQLIELEASPGMPLRFIAGGAAPPNPAELLGLDRMRELLAELVDRYDMVILDAPPLNLVTDAAILGTSADGVIVVARSGATDRGALAHAFHQLEAVRAPVLGTVLNDVDVRKERYYGGVYAHAAGHYGAD